MALFAIQLVRFVLVFISVPVEQDHVIQAGNDFAIVINQMLNVIVETWKDVNTRVLAKYKTT